MNDIMKPYIDLGKKILTDSNDCDDRTGAGTHSLFGHLLEFDTRKGAPFLTERKLPLRSVAGELAWFIEGSTDVNVLRDDYKCKFWDEWGSPKTNTVGPMYGKQWRNANGVDQLANILEMAVDTPNSRRLVIDSWMPDVLPKENTKPSDNPEKGKMALPPCHFAYQIRLYDDKETSVKWVDLMFQLRSSDYFLGLPNNIASYHMLQSLIAAYLTHATGIKHKPRYLKACLGDVHIYKNHVDECRELFTRNPSVEPPRYVANNLVLKYLLWGHTYELANVPGVRDQVLRDIHAGVRDYIGGEPIQGERNV